MGSARSCHQKKHGNSVRGFLAQHIYNFPSQASIVNPLLHGTFTPLSRSLVLFVSPLLALVITVRWIVLDLTKSDLRIFRTGLILWYLLTKGLEVGSRGVIRSYYHTSSISMLEVWRILDLLCSYDPGNQGASLLLSNSKSCLGLVSKHY